MKVTVKGQDFREAMKTAAAVFDAEAEVLLTSDPAGNRLVIEAGRSGIYCKQFLAATVEEPGQIVVACAHLAHLSLEENVYLESDDKHVAFKSGKFKGTVAGSSDTEEIEASRPEKPFKARCAIPTDVFRSALSRVSFGQALPGTQAGIRIQASDKLTLSTTDGYRATIYKEDLAQAQTDFDVLIQPAFLQTILSRVKSPEVSMGVWKGTFRLKTDVFDIYHPAIQSASEDIEGWIANGIDYEKRECVCQTAVEDFSKAIKEVSSIHMGALAYDTYIDLLIKSGRAHFRSEADHGSAQTSFKLESVSTEKYTTKLSSRYALEMLNLARAGEVEVSFWDAFLLVVGAGGKFKALIPTVAA